MHDVASGAYPASARADVATSTADPRRPPVDHALGAGKLVVHCERVGTDHLIGLGGELDVATAQALKVALETAEATDARRIILDLSGLEFMDSSGLHLIITASARSRIDGDRLRLRRGPPQVQRIFDITATTDLLPFGDG